ncbi:MAG: DUF2867 domain-containing protein [Jannaschia sp.]
MRRPGDFLDCYAVRSDMPSRTAAEIVVDFPPWARALVSLRNVVTAPFGLLPDGPEAADNIGFFPVTAEGEDEIVAGFDDRHLDFRVAIIRRDGFVHLATWVAPHNIGGRLYLKAILPFHVAIARNAMSRVSTARA